MPKRHISRRHSEHANFLGFGTFRQFLQLLLPCANMSSPGGGGGGMCILFEICKKTPFQKCMGWRRGGGGLPFFSVAQHVGRCTQTWHCTVHPFLFRITVIVSIPFFRQGWDPIRADIPLFVDRDIFLQFLPILQPPCLHWHPTFVKGHGPQAQWPQRSSECPAPCGSMWVAVSGRYGVF